MAEIRINEDWNRVETRDFILVWSMRSMTLMKGSFMEPNFKICIQRIFTDEFNDQFAGSYKCKSELQYTE